MKKVLTIVIVLVVSILSGVGNYQYAEEYKTRYAYLTDIKWERIDGEVVEYIYFANTGEYEYYREGGKLVKETENCANYRYNEDELMITLLCVDENIEIELVAYDEETLVLNFNGHIKEFKNDK